MEEVMVKEIREIKSMISELSSFLLKAMDMEIVPAMKDEISDEEREIIDRILNGKEKLMTEGEFEKYISESVTHG
ncbi:hypothetical protein BMS3Bbin15_00914 [archaeon BMS3Bbin15]|nr:hypothetical protein BMS3Bbin15_00914 [archaeon BMS3Bbin15]